MIHSTQIKLRSDEYILEAMIRNTYKATWVISVRTPRIAMNDTEYCRVGRVVEVVPHDDLSDFIFFTFGTLALGSLFVWLLSVIFNTDGNVCPPFGRGGVPPFDVKHEYYDTPHKVCGGAKVKHRVILVRHGESAHNKRHDGRDGETLHARPELDTELTDDGHIQADDVGRFLSEFNWNPDIIRVSPMLRTRQTSAPFLRRWICRQGLDTINSESHKRHIVETWRGMSTQFVPDGMCMEVNVWEDQPLKLDGYVTEKETYGDFVKRVTQWRKELEADGDACHGDKRIQTLVFTHSMVISEFLNTLASERRDNLGDDEWSNVYWQVNHGSVTCVDYMDNGEWHIHAMNYTRHITRYTGLKSPLV